MPPIIEIKLEHHFTAKIYTTGSSFHGYVSILPDHDLPVDEIDICFVGVVRKRLELYTSGNSDETFLEQRMPINAANLPQNKTFTARKEHRLPFNFTVPSRLTTEVCQHPCSHDLRDRHLHLLPTMGFWDGDNMCPDTTSIGYYIWASIGRRSPSSSKRVDVASAKLMLKVLPATTEDSPLVIGRHDSQFLSMANENIRQGLARGRGGDLSVMASPPSAVMLSSDGQKASPASVRLNLEFVPHCGQAEPPQPKAVTCRILSNTYYGPSKIQTWPHLGDRIKDRYPLLNYTAAFPSIKQAADKWEWREISLACPGTMPNNKSTNDEEAQIKFVSEVDVPLSIPHDARRFFLPTFHSCHISRIYTLQICVSFGAVKKVKLALPLQIGVESIHNRGSGDLISETGSRGMTSSLVDRLPKYGDVFW